MCNVALIADKPKQPLFNPLTGTRFCLEANWISFPLLLLNSTSFSSSPTETVSSSLFLSTHFFFFKINILRFLSLSCKSYEGILEGLGGINLKKEALVSPPLLLALLADWVRLQRTCLGFWSSPPTTPTSRSKFFIRASFEIKKKLQRGRKKIVSLQK